MIKNLLSSLKTVLGKISAAGQTSSGVNLAEGLWRKILDLPLAALLALAVMFFVWSCEHRVRLRDKAEAGQAKTQATEEISRLQKQAAVAIQEADQSTQASRQLEAQRAQLAREAEGLSQSLDALRKQEIARASEVATLSASEVFNRVATRLGSGEVAPAAGAPSSRDAEGGGQQATGTGPQSAASPSSSSRQTPVPSPGHILSEQGARAVETAFVDLDSCRQQAGVMTQQISNCEQRSKLDSTLIQQESATITNLNSALRDKDEVLTRSEEACRAEVKAARGTWQSRLVRAVEYMAGGFIAGVLVR